MPAEVHCTLHPTSEKHFYAMSMSVSPSGCFPLQQQEQRQVAVLQMLLCHLLLLVLAPRCRGSCKDSVVPPPDHLHAKAAQEMLSVKGDCLQQIFVPGLLITRRNTQKPWTLKRGKLVFTNSAFKLFPPLFLASSWQQFTRVVLLDKGVNEFWGISAVRFLGIHYRFKNWL